MAQHEVLAQQTNEPKPPYILALDVGTSSTRALLFDATGASIPSVLARRQYQLMTEEQGEVAVDGDDLVTLVGQTIDDALHLAGPMAKQIGAVAIDTFWHSLIAVDGNNRPLTPVITWEDTRPHGAAMELAHEFDEQAVHARTGARFHASYWPAKIRWLSKTQPNVVKQTAQWLSFGEYLYRKLLGRSICSLSMASGTGMLNLRERTWDKELIEALGVRAEQFPQLGDVGDSIQGLTSEHASGWSVLRDVPWFPATGDGAAACVGSGCATTENWSLTVGTSSAIRVVLPPEQVTPPLGLWLYLIDGKRGVMGGALSEGGNMLNWLDTVLKLPSLAASEPLVASIKPDSHGLTILPFISGERSLGWHADARMTVMHLNVHTTPADLLRAGMEALTYQLGAVYTVVSDTLKLERQPRLIGSGGALLGSPSLQQMLADMLGTPLYPSKDHEASARGAALLALESLGIIPDLSQVAPVLDEPFQPDAARGAIYKQAAQRQQELYQKLLG